MNTKESLAEIGIDCSVPPATASDGYPEWWPVLEPGDVNTGKWENSGAPSCLMGWLGWITGEVMDDADSIVVAKSGIRENIYHVLRKTVGLGEWLRTSRVNCDGSYYVTDKNDGENNALTSNAQRAAWWNHCGRDLGYLIPAGKCVVSKSNPNKLGLR